MPKLKFPLLKMLLMIFELTAPFDGLLADVSVDVGQQVGPQTVAVSVIDPN